MAQGLSNVRVLGVIGAANAKLITGRMDFDNNYPAGGYPIGPVLASMGISGVSDMIIGRPAGPNVEVAFDIANQTVRVFTGGGVEVNAGSDQSSNTNVPFICIGST